MHGEQLLFLSFIQKLVRKLFNLEFSVTWSQDMQAGHVEVDLPGDYLHC